MKVVVEVVPLDAFLVNLEVQVEELVVVVIVNEEVEIDMGSRNTYAAPEPGHES